MLGIFLALLFLADDAAIRKTIATFNHTHERASVLTPNAKIPDFARCWQQERSQMYFEVKAVRFVGSDVAVVDASGNRYGSMVGKQSAPAEFVLRRDGAGWKVDTLRVFDSCLMSKR